MIVPLKTERTSVGEEGYSDLPHVLLVLDQFPRYLGGGERIVLRLAALLPEYGYRTSIVTFSVHPDCPDLACLPCPVYVLPLRRTSDIKALLAAIEFRRFLRDERVQIVQTFFESSDVWAGFVTKMTSSAKLIWSRRDMGILRKLKHRIAYRLMARMPDAVFTVSDEVRRYSSAVDGVNPAKIFTIYSGIDLAGWDEIHRPLTSGDVQVVTLGNIRRVKGHDLLVKAAALILPQFPTVKFTIAGEILEREYFLELEALIRSLGIEDHFQFVGGVADTRTHLAAADIFVLPSRSEGFSNAIIEAMAASLPVVATDVGGNSEAVEDKVTGFVVRPEDPGALAAAIGKLLLEPARARAMGTAGRTRVAERFTTEAMMKMIVGVYRRLLQDTA